jgi:hypothetical protein
MWVIYLLCSFCSQTTAEQQGDAWDSNLKEDPETLNYKLVLCFIPRSYNHVALGIQLSDITTTTCLYRVGKPVILHVGLYPPSLMAKGVSLFKYQSSNSPNSAQHVSWRSCRTATKKTSVIDVSPQSDCPFQTCLPLEKTNQLTHHSFKFFSTMDSCVNF